MTANIALSVVPVPGFGTEDVLVDDDGSLVTGTADGSVFHVSPDGARIRRLGDTGGRPMGLEHLPDGRVLVCDAARGLLALDRTTGRTEVLTGLLFGLPMKFCNNAAVAPDGTIWFTDSSRRYGMDRWEADLAENTTTGRFLRRDPDGGVEVVLDRMRFPNGVALADDGSFVAVAETAARTVSRVWLTGPDAGRRDLLLADMPGYPDNIARGSDGLIWVTVASPVDPVLERVMRAPMPVRRAAWRMPSRVRPTPQRTVRVLAVDDAGTVVHDLTADATRFHMATGVREHAGSVWVSSLHEPALARLEVSLS